MRKAGRVVVLFFLSLLSTAALSAVAALVAAVSLAATALIVPGTGTPDANTVGNYRQNFRDYYMQSTPCTNNTNCPPNDTTNPLALGMRGIDYPASFWPIPLPGWCPGLSCDTFDVSVAKGVTNLDAVLTILANTPGFTDNVVIAGYSQGARVVSIEKMKFVNGAYPNLAGRVSFVYIGNPNRPNGGILSRLGFLGRIPILNVTTGQPTPTGPPDFETHDWAIRWEGIADWPTFLLNPLAVANSILGFAYDHGTYLGLDGDLPAGYTLDQWRAITENPESYPGIVNIDDYGDTRYYTVTPKVLPLVRPLHAIPLIGKPIADLFEPALRVIIEETGYARQIPFGAPIGTGLIPIFNPITLVLKLIPAILQGINNFFANFGLTQEIPFAPSLLSTTSTTSVAPPSDAAADESAVAGLSLVEDSGQQQIEGEAVVVEETVAEEAVLEEAVVEEAVVEEAVVEEAVAEEAVAEEAVAEEPVAEEPVIEETAADSVETAKPELEVVKTERETAPEAANAEPEAKRDADNDDATGSNDDSGSNDNDSEQAAA